MLRKGDRVTFTSPDDGRMLYGIVESGGKRKVTVIEDGGRMQHSGPPKCFPKTNHPLPADDPSVMDRYEIRKWQSAGRDDTERFQAELYRDGECIGTISNSGHGESDLFQLKNDDYKQFQNDIQEWIKQMGGEDVDMYEPDSFWAHWWWKDRKYGVTAKEAIAEYQERMAEIFGK